MTILAWAVLAFAAWPRCPSRKWGRYDCPDEFGYAEWWCQKRRWHRGNHAALYDPCASSVSDLHK